VNLRADDGACVIGDHRLAHVGWQLRLTTSTEVKPATSEVSDPSITFLRTYAVCLHEPTQTIALTG